MGTAGIQLNPPLSVACLAAALVAAGCEPPTYYPPLPRPGAEDVAPVPDPWEVLPAADLAGETGRVRLTFPPGTPPEAAKVEVFKPGEDTPLTTHQGDWRIDLPPGSYDVAVSGKRAANVPVRAGHETRMKVGLFKVFVARSTLVDVMAPRSFDCLPGGGQGSRSFALLAGPYDLRVSGQYNRIAVEDGKVSTWGVDPPPRPAP